MGSLRRVASWCAAALLLPSLAISVSVVTSVAGAHAAAATATTRDATPAWATLATATTPQDRRDQSMAYDADTGRVVMFGGTGDSSGAAAPRAAARPP